MASHAVFSREWSCGCSVSETVSVEAMSVLVLVEDCSATDAGGGSMDARDVNLVLWYTEPRVGRRGLRSGDLLDRS